MVWILVAVGTITAVILLGVAVVLLRHLRGLSTSLHAMQADLIPVLADIQRRSEEAQRTLARVQERATAILPEPD